MKRSDFWKFKVGMKIYFKGKEVEISMLPWGEDDLVCFKDDNTYYFPQIMKDLRFTKPKNKEVK
jgi:hypothetical protein